MKHQQVVVDYWTMVKTSCLCLLLAFSGYILIKMVQTVFWLPGHLKNNQKRLEDLAKQYGQDIDEDERAEIEKIFNSEPATEELKKEQ
ncbi:uncharacterized protein LOC115620569 [Scaptodrosophila lebanonensis]|uniref:Uncharacterized protein LOC115620569 n=1 Tax=Drosophila lebanonensis TaxID=7225 RepID=A0A6J2T357_DROLE|nr:uncharacterized protein LOC115620569 [Scaptodrosophila lebanonensis]